MYSIRVRTTDSTNQTYEKVLTIQVVDVNEATTLTLQNVISLLPENANSAGRVKVADIVVVDDALGNETLTLLGPDATMFEILGNELFVRSGVTLDFETRSTFAIDIEMDDPTLGSTPEGLESYSLTLSDVDEFDVTQPVDQDAANNEVIENAAVGTPVGITVFCLRCGRIAESSQLLVDWHWQ